MDSKYLTFKLTTDEFKTVCDALFEYKRGTNSIFRNVMIIGTMTAQCESQQVNPHPDAVKIANERK